MQGAVASVALPVIATSSPSLAATTFGEVSHPDLAVQFRQLLDRWRALGAYDHDHWERNDPDLTQWAAWGEAYYPLADRILQAPALTLADVILQAQAAALANIQFWTDERTVSEHPSSGDRALRLLVDSVVRFAGTEALPGVGVLPLSAVLIGDDDHDNVGAADHAEVARQTPEPQEPDPAIAAIAAHQAAMTKVKRAVDVYRPLDRDQFSETGRSKEGTSARRRAERAMNRTIDQAAACWHKLTATVPTSWHGCEAMLRYIERMREEPLSDCCASGDEQETYVLAGALRQFIAK